jgi:hypothetical protein
MNCTATLPGKSRLCRIFAVALFLSCLAVQSGFSAEPGSITPETNAEVASPKNKSVLSTRPFSHVAVGVSLGLFGPGIQVVTPLSRKTNLRVDGSFFNYNLGITQDSVHYSGNLSVREVRATYDYYPFRGAFRISGGAVVYNGFNIGANANLPAGSKITLNDNDYYSAGGSSALQANAKLIYGNKVAPTFTFGWGNALPRSGRHLAFPVEIGVAYTGTPTFNLNASGEACSGGPCGTPGSSAPTSVTSNATFQSNLTTQVNKIKNDLQPAKVYPIINFGVTYRFF